MNCRAILQLILEADPAELAGQRDDVPSLGEHARAPSVLREHLRACGRCRAVAQQILADTKRLEWAIATRVAPSPLPIEVGARGLSSARGRLVMAALAAAIVAIAVLRGAGDAVDQTGSSRVARTATAQAAEQTTTRETRGAPQDVMTFEGAAPTQAAAARATRRVVAVPVTAVAFPKASDVAPARFALSNAGEGMPPHGPAVAAVDPVPGKRVAILRTSDPTVTVFWLY